MSILFTFLGLTQAPFRQQKATKQTIDTLNNREEMKLAQLEAYMSADDEQGVADLSLYF